MTAPLDPDRQIALAHVPAAHRPALDALWRLDVSLGAVLATGREPMVSRIRLAWWREALERLDREAPPAEPLLEAVAGTILPAGVTGASLAGMVEGWDVLLDPGPLGAAELDLYARARGVRLFAFSARLLGDPGFPTAGAGRRWALADLARRSTRPDEAAAALGLAREADVPDRWPPALRPLGMLAMLAGRDLAGPAPERQGSPGRMWRMLRHRLTGR